MGSDAKDWKLWLDGKVGQDAAQVLVRRDVWREVQNTLRGSSGLPNSYFWAYLIETYLDAQLIAIRRLVDRGATTQSLYKILHGIEQSPKKIQFETWILNNGADPHAMGVEWRQRYGEPENGHIPKRFATEALAKLKTAVQIVEDYANSYTAHASRTPRVAELPHADLDAAIDAVHVAYTQCLQMVNGATFGYDAPSHAWDAVFDVAWRKEPKYEHMRRNAG